MFLHICCLNCEISKFCFNKTAVRISTKYWQQCCSCQTTLTQLHWNKLWRFVGSNRLMCRSDWTWTRTEHSHCQTFNLYDLNQLHSCHSEDICVHTCLVASCLFNYDLFKCKCEECLEWSRWTDISLEKWVWLFCYQWYLHYCILYNMTSYKEFDRKNESMCRVKYFKYFSVGVGTSKP